MLKEIQIIMEQDQKLNQMANNFLITITVIILSSCQKQNSEKKQNAFNLANKEENKTVFKTDYYADMGVKNIVKLMDSKSVKENITIVSEKEYFNDLLFLSNNNQSEYLIIGRSYGGMKNEFNTCDLVSIKEQSLSEIKEYHSRPVYSKNIKSGVESFKTDSEIQLGISEKRVLQIKGNKYKTDSLPNGGKIITYIIDNPNSKILLYNNMPVYVAEFYFKNEKLYRYKFGFPNP